MSSGSRPYLPSSVIFEILVKLPIKSLIRFRRVCRTWNSMISERYFATLYFKNPPSSVFVLSHHRIEEDDESFYFIEIGLNGDVMRTPFNPKAMDFRTNGFGWALFPIGSCNGLFCFVLSPPYENEINSWWGNWENVYNNEAVFIINPLLGEVMMLPQVISPLLLSYHTNAVVYAFSFSTHSDNYKVLRFVNSALGQRIHGEIFTIGVDRKWRSLEDSSSFPLFLHSHGVNLNGVVYFFGNGYNGYCYIFAFDVEEERGRQIHLPCEITHREFHTKLAACNDGLCLFDDDMSHHELVIWTMKLNGGVETWSREIILKCWIPLDLPLYSLIPITTLRNGDLLMFPQCPYQDLKPGLLISYNPKTKECRTHELGVGESDSVCFFAYVPSFFPLSTVMCMKGD